jgi:hypothetical protein
VWSIHGDLGNTSTHGGYVRLIGRGLAVAQGRGFATSHVERDGSSSNQRAIAAKRLIHQLSEAIHNGSDYSQLQARDLSIELQSLLSTRAGTTMDPSSRSAADGHSGGSTYVRLVPTASGGAPIIIAANWTNEEFEQRGDFSATFFIPQSVPLGVYKVSVAVTNRAVSAAAASNLHFFNVSTFVSPETPQCTTITIRAPLAYKKERFVVERPPLGKRTPTCKGDYGTKPGSPGRAFDSLPALQSAFSKAIAK